MNQKVKRNTRIKERRPMQGRRTEQTCCFHTILVKLGLAEKTIGTDDAFYLFLKIGSDPIVKAKNGNGFPRQVTAPYLATALKLNAMTADELKSLKLRIAEYR